MLLPLLPALLAALAPSLPCRGWSPSSAASGSGRKETPPPELPLPPANSSASFSTAAAAVAAKSPFPTAGGALAADFPEARERATEATPGPTTSAAAEAAAPSPGPPRPAPHQQQQQQHQPPPPREDPPCNISVQRQMLSSLLVRWSPLGFQTQCDLVLFSTSGPGGRAFFSAAFHRVGPPPLLIDHVGLAAGGAQQDLRLCVGCSWARGRRVGRLRPGPPSNPPSSPSAALFSSSSSSSPSSEHGQPWQQGERLHFCCLDFSLEELKGDPGWRMNRKPIESTLVACFMTLVIIVWSVAALIWPVPIIAGFLPNGMEQRRGAATSGGAPGAGAAAK